MKKILKYFIAVIQLGAVGIAFSSLFDMPTLRVTMVNFIRLGFGYAGDIPVYRFVDEYLRHQIRPLVFITLALLVCIIFGGLGVLLASFKSAYAIALCSIFVNNLLFAFIYMQMINRFEGVLWLTPYRNIIVNHTTIWIWLGVNVLILGLSGVGLILTGKKTVSYTDNFITETYS